MTFQFIHDAADTDQPFGGFGDVPPPKEEDGKTLVLVGTDEVYREVAAGYFPSQRLIIGVHYFPPGRSHSPHDHPTWEQAYYVISGTAKLIVGSEERVVGPGGCSYTPAGVTHDFINIGEDELVVMVISAVLE